MTDTDILDWLEQEKPDIWFRRGLGIWVISDEITDLDRPRYNGRTLRNAIETAMAAWDERGG